MFLLFKYISDYLTQNPDQAGFDYPTFDDFDQDRSGKVSFNEWQSYLYYRQLAEEGYSESEAFAAP